MSEQQTLNLKIAGLYTHPNDLSEVPDGALVRAKNVNIDEESVAAPRRGFDRMGYGVGTSPDRVGSLLEYQNTLLAHYGGDTLARDTGSAWTDYSGTFAVPVSNVPVRSVQLNGNLYFTTSEGLKRLDSVTGTPTSAGLPKGLSLTASLTGSSGFLSDTNYCAYRVVWGFKDAGDNLILGAPSERLVVRNTAGGGATRNVSLTITIPAGITTANFVQVYRSLQTSAAEPSDEMQLTLELFPAAGDITAAAITATDNRVDDILGATIYTAPSQETLANQNETPPFGQDVAVFRNHVFLGNVRSKHRLFVTILAADGGGSPGTALQVDDVVTIGGVAYTGKSSTSVASNQFAVSSSADIGIAIRDTALELCRVVNSSASNTGANAVYAYYVSAEDDTPGRILLESRSVGGAQFAVTYTPNSHSGNPFQPVLPASGTSVSSSNDAFTDGLVFSKFQQPEAFPLGNQFRVGQSGEQIRRIIPLRDSLFIFKDDGIYRLTGSAANSFRVELFDETARIRSPRTAVTLGNAIYMLSDQGVVRVTETGVSVISRPIETTLLQAQATATLATIQAQGFAISYETERKYILCLPVSSSDTSAKIFYVYNTFTSAWTTWEDLDILAGRVFTGDDKLYLSDAGSNFVLEERKAYSIFDHGDYLGASTISGVTGELVTLSNTSLLAKGDVIYQSDTSYAVVETVDTAAGTVTTSFNGGLSAAAATLYRAIDSAIEWTPIHAGNASIIKQWREVAFLFRRSFALEATAEFSTDQSESVDEVVLSGRDFGNWGFFVWGAVPWGGEIARLPIRTYVPLDKQRATQLNCAFVHRVGFSDFKLSGMATHFRPVSERFSS